MKLNSLQLRHFISHGSTDLVLNGARLATFVGANGSGKSALAIDALRYSLFDDARGRTDDLVQLGQTDMSVRAEITFAGAEYSITRGRSTKARGSSFLELCIRDGETWRPLTGPTIKDTQAAIAELLRMDADTFDTAVLLGQGQANRFAEATAGDRKKILGTVLGLDLWERAEARAREQARDVEAATAADRATIGRLEAELAGREALETSLQEARGRDATLTASEERERAALVEHQAIVADVAAQIAAGEAAEAQVRTAQAALADVSNRFRAVSARKVNAEGRIREAETALRALPAMPEGLGVDRDACAADVERLEAAEAQDRELERAIATNEQALERERARIETLRADWDYRRRSAQSHVDQLTEQLAALPKVTCPKCDTTFVPSEVEASLRTKLAGADRALAEVGEEPTPPLHLDVEAAKIERLRIHRRELAFDVVALGEARAQLREADAARELVVRRGALEQAIAQDQAAIAEATTELAEIQEAGKAARAALVEAETKTGSIAGLRTRLVEARGIVSSAEFRLAQLAADRRKQAGDIAQAQAGLERLDRIQTERDELAGGISTSSAHLARLRKLVAAFSVKGIPARIIESTIPEFAANANTLLSELRPGMELSIQMQRAKADGKGVVEALDLIVRDDAGERPLALFSGGERTSVSLAIAVGLSQLVARRAGSRIESLVIDEPDGLDVDARRAFGQALRILAHQGELSRVVLVSHHPDLADYGDAVYQISKDGAGSHVEQIA
jgi:exonuclease SbcC